jgi:hypothetical protein
MDNKQPFTSGTQWADWQNRNCANCAKGAEDFINTERFPACPIYAAIVLAYAGDGTVPAEIAERMAVPERGYTWQCGEFTPK